MSKQVHVLVFDGYADWEPSYALAELRRSGHHDVVTVGFSTDAVTSMGGLRVLPHRALADVRVEDVLVLILPGGDMWEDEHAYPREALEALVRSLVAAGRPVAAICAATTALARAGLLDDHRHTSNGADYLAAAAPAWRGAARYAPELAVRDRGVITASGLGAVDFAREIFAELAVFDGADAQLWYDMFRHGRMPAGA